jgi:hypothetical protein
MSDVIQEITFEINRKKCSAYAIDSVTYFPNGHSVTLDWVPFNRCRSGTDPVLEVTTTVPGLNVMDFAIGGTMMVESVMNLLEYVRLLPHI